MTYLVENTVVAGVFAVAVFGICRFLRPRPAWGHVLWVLVLLKLLTPPVFHWSVLPPLAASRSIPADPRASSPRVSASAGARLGSPAPDSPSGATPRDDAERRGGRAPAETTPRTDTGQPAAREGAPVADPPASELRETAVTFSAVLRAGWIFGSGVMLLAVLVGVLRVRRRTRVTRPVPAWLQEEVRRLAARFAVAAPEIRVVDGVGSAFVWSVVRPQLIWPAARLDPAEVVQARTVVAHELAHIRRRDHWVAWLEVAAMIALWWHPLVWLARAGLRQYAELACDAWAVWAVPAARHAYAGALIDALEQDSPAVAAVPVLGARPAVRRAFEKRLLMILNEDVPRRLSRWALVPVALLSMTVLSSFTAAQDTKREKNIQKEVLRSVNEHLRKTLGPKYQVRDLSEIDAKVKAYVRDRREAELRASRRRDRDERDRGDRRREDRRREDRRRDERRRDERRRDERRREERDTRRRRPATGTGDTTVREAIREGIEEARREIRNDPDLKRLGIAGDVEKLLGSLINGGDFEGDLENLIGKALRAALKEARTEIRNDPDLKKLGIAGDIDKMLGGFIEAQLDSGALQGLAMKAMRMGLQQAREEIRDNRDLKELGIAGDVDALLKGLIDGKGGKNLGDSLENIIQKALKHGLRDLRGGPGNEGEKDRERNATERAKRELRRREGNRATDRRRRRRAV